jgi:hypothetical protein
MGTHIIRGGGGEQLQVEIDGALAVDAIGTATAASGAATLNKATGVITSESLTTADADTPYTLTLTNSKIKATSVVLASVGLGSATTGTPQIVSVTPAAGSVVILVWNVSASAAFNGTIKVAFTVLN